MIRSVNPNYTQAKYNYYMSLAVQSCLLISTATIITFLFILIQYLVISDINIAITWFAPIDGMWFKLLR